MKNKIINLFGNDRVVQNEGVKYSKLLEQFIEPFVKEFGVSEDIFEFAMNAWNMGNMQSLVSNDEFGKDIQSVQNKDKNFELLKKMIDYKIEIFKEHTNFIIDFELKGSENNLILSVVTQEEEAYLSNMMNTIENEDNQDDFKQNYIDRNAIIIKPRQPFIDWCSNLNLEDDLEEIKKTNVYLVHYENETTEKWLKKKFDTFFTLELDEWCMDKKAWPQKRNYKMFKFWFEVDVSKLIYDLEKKPVLKSE